MNEYKIRKIFKKYGLFSKQDRRNYDFYNKAIEELSNLIGNQDKIDCYDKTGEIISNDGGEELREGMTEKEIWFKSSEGHRKTAEKYYNRYLKLMGILEEINHPDFQRKDIQERFKKEEISGLIPKQIGEDEIVKVLSNNGFYHLKDKEYYVVDFPKVAKQLSKLINKE